MTEHPSEEERRRVAQAVSDAIEDMPLAIVRHGPAIPEGRRWCPLCCGEGVVHEGQALDVRGTRVNWEEMRAWLFQGARVIVCPECRGVGHVEKGLPWGLIVWLPLIVLSIAWVAWAAWVAFKGPPPCC